jgi:hypothetical protein
MLREIAVKYRGGTSGMSSGEESIASTRLWDFDEVKSQKEDEARNESFQTIRHHYRAPKRFRRVSFSNANDYSDVMQFAKRVFDLQDPDLSKTPDTNGPNPLP